MLDGGWNVFSSQRGLWSDYVAGELSSWKELRGNKRVRDLVDRELRAALPHTMT